MIRGRRKKLTGANAQARAILTHAKARIAHVQDPKQRRALEKRLRGYIGGQLANAPRASVVDFAPNNVTRNDPLDGHRATMPHW